MLMRKCLLAMLMLILVILTLILKILNLNTDYADLYYSDVSDERFGTAIEQLLFFKTGKNNCYLTSENSI